MSDQSTPGPEGTSEQLTNDGGTRTGGGRKRGLVIGGAVAAVAVAGGAAWAATSFLGQGAQPAEALPAATLGYASVDLDPSGSQKVEALQVLRKFPAIKEELVATPKAAAVSLEYRAAHFRCEQALEGFARISGGKLGVLVQPVDLIPSAVAGCDCLYDIGIAIEDLKKGSLAVELYRRWDNLNEPNDPEKVGSAEVQIP